MQIIIVSGYSGSGKSVALATLEDEGYYCIDNIPTAMLPSLVKHLQANPKLSGDNVAVGVDARSQILGLAKLDENIELLKRDGVSVKVLFLTSEFETLLIRFSETRRKHPLSNKNVSLAQAINDERTILQVVTRQADLIIDTTKLNLHQLRQQIRLRLLGQSSGEMSLLFQSFGFKHGAPIDSDFTFDVRCLPNPHWDPALRELTGLDEPVANFLQDHAIVNQMRGSIQTFLETYIPIFQAENRAYLTISIGCTGGQHRSVFITDNLQRHFCKIHKGVSVRHRELSRAN